jgi:hypothetical protein
MCRCLASFQISTRFLRMCKLSGAQDRTGSEVVSDSLPRATRCEASPCPRGGGNLPGNRFFPSIPSQRGQAGRSGATLRFVHLPSLRGQVPSGGLFPTRSRREDGRGCPVACPRKGGRGGKWWRTGGRAAAREPGLESRFALERPTPVPSGALAPWQGKSVMRNQSCERKGKQSRERQWKSVTRAAGKSVTRVAGKSVMRAEGNSVMRAEGKSVMRAEGKSVMRAEGKSVMRAEGKSVMRAEGKSVMLAQGNSVMRRGERKGIQSCERKGNRPCERKGDRIFLISLARVPCMRATIGWPTEIETRSFQMQTNLSQTIV